MKREDIDKILAELQQLECKSQKDVEDARVRFLGKKGSITALFEEFRDVDKDQKREFGRPLNELKQAAQAKIDELKDSVVDEGPSDGPKQDLSMPGDSFELGSRHPVSIVRQEIVDVFRSSDTMSPKALRWRTTTTYSRPSTSLRTTLHAICRTRSSCLRAIRTRFFSEPTLPVFRSVRWNR